MAREFSKAFYNSKEWQNTRQYVLKRDNYLCQFCHRPAEEVHHIIELSPKNIGDISVTMNPDNLVSLCRDCHIRHHERERLDAVGMARRYAKHKRLTREDGTFFDENGMLQMTKVHIIYGCPRSGKSTYVHRHKQDGDLIIDIDELIYALQGSRQRMADNNLFPLAIKISDYIIDLIKSKDETIDCKNIWLIGSFPEKEMREKLAAELNAELILIDCTIKEAIERAKMTNEYNDIEYSEWVVNRWFKRYQP